MEELSILSTTRYQGDALSMNEQRLFSAVPEEADPLKACYHALGFDHPKFFKMDGAAKLMLLATEPLFRAHASLLEPVKDKIGLVLFSRSGSAEVDQRYWTTLEDEQQASPALFVYTLPNIAAGELTIRHKLHGPSLSLLSEKPDAAAMHVAARTLFQHHGLEFAICGWSDIFAGHRSAHFFLLARQGGQLWNNERLQDLFHDNHDGPLRTEA